MKKITAFMVLPVIALLFYGCTKNNACSPISPSVEATQILTFASANGINTTLHSSGIYYEIIDPGTGDTPDLSSKISVTYTTWVLDGSASGTIIDNQSTPTMPTRALNGFIEAWQVGLPLIQEGGTIKMIVPSALAFGCEPYNGIPGNSILYFEIRLVTVE